jgi:hypothetical protein
LRFLAICSKSVRSIWATISHNMAIMEHTWVISANIRNRSIFNVLYILVNFSGIYLTFVLLFGVAQIVFIGDMPRIHYDRHISLVKHMNSGALQAEKPLVFSCNTIFRNSTNVRIWSTFTFLPISINFDAFPCLLHLLTFVVLFRIASFPHKDSWKKL